MRLIILLLSFLLPIVGSAQELSLCRSPYALTSENFNYKEYKRQTSDIGKYTVVWLWNTFGDALGNAQKELLREQVVGVELALFNTTCVRNRSCGSYETLAGYTIQSLNKAIQNQNPQLRAKIKTEAKRAADWLLPRLKPSQRCYINPFLEHNMDRNTWQTAVMWFVESFHGRCEMVWNPAGSNPGKAQSPAGVSEGHGDSPNLEKRCIANPDGTVIDFSEYPSYLIKYGQKCEHACAWLPNDNCRTAGETRFVDPRKRLCKETGDFKKERAAIKAARKLNKPVPPWSESDNKSLAGCTKIYPNPDGEKKGFLSKDSHVPHYGWTILFPNPLRFKSAVVQKAGKNISDLKYYYPYEGDGRQVWRAQQDGTSFPYNVAIRAKDSQGKLACWKVPNPKVRND